MLAVLALVLFSPHHQHPSFFYAGGDPSEIPEVEAAGGVYRVHGKPVDPLLAMKQAGWTAVRLRVWNDPSAHAHFCDLPHTLAMAKRIKSAGLKLMIDFHYSDWWADPGKQNKPEAWTKLNLQDLTKAVHDYSRDVVKALADQDTPADVVQPGNEVTNGFLWPDARLNINGDGWPAFMQIEKAAIAGIREGAGEHRPKIMIHIDQGGRSNISRFWFDNYFKRGGECDLIGLSYYPFWHGTLRELRSNLQSLAHRYHKPVIVAETAFAYQTWRKEKSPVPGFDETPAGQAGYLRRLTSVVKSGGGAGVLWWAPAWISTPGQHGGWGRLTLFNSQTGEALPAFFAFAK